MTTRLTACGLTILVTASAAHAQTRPLQTEEATTARAGRIALEAGGAFQAAQPSFLSLQPRDVWSAPIVNLVWSPAANVEVDLEWVVRVGESADPTFGSASDFGDVTLRTKLRFVEEKGRRPAIGARFTVTLPETDQAKGLGPNTNRMQAQALLTEVLGRVRLHANAGLAIHDQTFGAHAQHDLFAYGGALEVGVTRRLSVVGEAAGRAGKGDPGVDRTHEARFGARFQTGRIRWDGAVRRGLSDADGKWGFTAGLTWTAQAGR